MINKLTIIKLLLGISTIVRYSHMTSSLASSILRKVPNNKLGISEPPPSWFGNEENIVSNNWNNKNWLKSRFHFSFAEYNNPKNIQFGVLRVMNDDLVQAKRGFGAHPHRDVEICTYIVEGELTHKDSMGTAETLQRGDIQYMSAGTGVEHSEHNLGNSPLRFIQIWINTRQRGLKPVYGSLKGNEESRLNKWVHLVQDIKNTNIDCPIKINQDSNIFVTEIDPNISLNLEIQNDRQGYLLCIEGDNNIIQGKDNQINLSRHDAAEIIGPQTLSITTSNNKSHFLLVEMKYELGSGRKDL